MYPLQAAGKRKAPNEEVARHLKLVIKRVLCSRDCRFCILLDPGWTFSDNCFHNQLFAPTGLHPWCNPAPEAIHYHRPHHTNTTTSVEWRGCGCFFKLFWYCIPVDQVKRKVGGAIVCKLNVKRSDRLWGVLRLYLFVRTWAIPIWNAKPLQSIQSMTS